MKTSTILLFMAAGAAAFYYVLHQAHTMPPQAKETTDLQKIGHQAGNAGIQAIPVLLDTFRNFFKKSAYETNLGAAQINDSYADEVPYPASDYNPYSDEIAPEYDYAAGV